MTIKAYNAGSLSLKNDIQAEFGGPTTNISLFSYRAGAGRVPGGTIGYPRPNGTATAISSAIASMNALYGSSAATYAVVGVSSAAGEGQSILFQLNTTNVPYGSTLYYTLSGIVSAADFVSGSLSGSFTTGNALGPNPNLTYISGIDFANDALVEGPETFVMQIRTGSISGPIVATSQVITINDTTVTSFTFNDIVSSNLLAGYSLYSRASSAGWNGTSTLLANITVNSGVYIIGTSLIPGFDTGSTLPSGSTITLTNNGVIGGAGGTGGQGGSANNASLTNGSAGSAGGAAFITNNAINIYNNGTIGGGGGGGGGGGSAYWDVSSTDKAGTVTISFYDASGGGGGGGQSLGSRGANGSASATGGPAYGPDVSPTNGTLTAPGAGSSSSNVGATGPDGGVGGAGGSFGQPGSPGAVTYSNSQYTAASAAGAGGAAGSAIVGGAYITWYAHSTRLGTYDSAGTNTVPTQGTAGQAVVAGGGAGAGGGGGGGSVSVSAFMPYSSKLAGEFLPGDGLVLLNAARDGYITGPVISNRISSQNLLRLTSSSGISLTCSDNTPLTLRDGSSINSTEALGVQLPVLDATGFRWEDIVQVESIGTGYVTTIFCDNQCYAAGDESGRYIFTHNLTVIKA